MKIKVSSEEELIKIAEESIRIIANLRKFTRLWDESHGVELKARKKYYEAQADELIERLQSTNLQRREGIKIEINADTNTTETH
jgi:hypothetical protein